MYRVIQLLLFLFLLANIVSNTIISNTIKFGVWLVYNLNYLLKIHYHTFLFCYY